MIDNLSGIQILLVFYHKKKIKNANNEKKNNIKQQGYSENYSEISTDISIENFNKFTPMATSKLAQSCIF